MKTSKGSGSERTAFDARTRFAKDRPTVLMLCSLQGQGKTTTAAKLARRLKLDQKAPGLVSPVSGA